MVCAEIRYTPELSNYHWNIPVGFVISELSLEIEA